MEILAFWDNFQELRPARLPSLALILSSSVLKDSFVFKTAETLVIQSQKSSKLIEIPFQEPIQSIATNLSLVYFLSKFGQVWAYGSDDLKSGLFCTESMYSSSIPFKIPFFESTPLIKLSLSKGHSAGITSEGVLYTWGSGQNGQLGEVNLKSCRPTMVQKASFFKSTDLTCGSNFTAVCTEAGLLFLFGKKSNCPRCKKSSSYPCTVNDLENDFVTRVFGYAEELVVLNDLGEAKLVSNCFCVFPLNCKSRVAEVVSVDGGLVGLAADKKVIYLWKRGVKEWSTENYSILYGDVSRIGLALGKSLAVFGRGLTNRSIKKVRDINVLDCSSRSNADCERVSFDEIVSTLGFKGKIYCVDQGKIYGSIEKVYLALVKSVMQEIWKYSFRLRITRTSRNMASAPFKLEKTIQTAICRLLGSVFIRLKKCPKKQLSSVFSLSNRFVSISIEKYWNTWTSISAGYRKARAQYQPLYQKASILFLSSVLNRISLKSLKHQFRSFACKTSHKKSNNLQSSAKLLLVLTQNFSITRLKLLRQAFGKLDQHIVTHVPKQSSLSIRSSLPIEVLPSYPAKGLTQPNSLSHSFVTESELSSYSKPPAKKTDSKPPKYTPSHKLSNGSYFENLSPNSDLAPDIRSPNLRAQLSKTIGQKSYHPALKLTAVSERGPKSSGSQTSRKNVKDSRKNLSANDPLSPKVVIKAVNEDKSSKANQKSLEVQTFAFLQKTNALYTFIKKVANRAVKDYFCCIANQNNLKPKVVSWKIKMFSLAFNKLFRVFNFLVKRRKTFAYSLVKSAEPSKVQIGINIVN